MKITSANNPSTFCKHCALDHDCYTDVYLSVEYACKEGGMHNDDTTHCHEIESGLCMPFIEDCENHAESCDDSCHDECACKNP